MDFFRRSIITDRTYQCIAVPYEGGCIQSHDCYLCRRKCRACRLQGSVLINTDLVLNFRYKISLNVQILNYIPTHPSGKIKLTLIFLPLCYQLKSSTFAAICYKNVTGRKKTILRSNLISYIR